MQVLAHTWQGSGHPKTRSNGARAGLQTSMAVDRVDDRGGGQRGGASRGARRPTSEDAPEKTSHMEVFLARSLSSTLTALQLSSLASEAAGLDGSSSEPDAQVELPHQAATLDDLLSDLLSAA